MIDKNLAKAIGAAIRELIDKEVVKLRTELGDVESGALVKHMGRMTGHLEIKLSHEIAMLTELCQKQGVLIAKLQQQISGLSRHCQALERKFALVSKE